MRFIFPHIYIEGNVCADKLTNYGTAV